jgi:quinol-cytochrome oxidoreductase complex cytochrome b subunit
VGSLRELRVSNVLLGTLAALGALLLITGLWLTFRYVPGPGRAWTVGAAHELHRFSGYAFAVVSVLLVVNFAVRTDGQRVRRAWKGVVAGVALAVAVGVGLVSGPKLAWDQLALWAVTTGSSFRGVFHTHVKYVLADGGELSVSSYNRWAWVHVLGVPLAIVACLVLLAVLARDASDDGSTEPVAAAVS